MTKSKSVMKSIFTIDTYVGKQYVYESNFFQPLKKLFYKKSGFVTAYLSGKDIVITTVALSRRIPREDISDALYVKVYEELSLDEAQEYIIDFYEIATTTDDREFRVFVVQPDVLKDLFSSAVAQIKYIDLIVPMPLLYRSLYSRGILAAAGTHCFVYFTKSDAMIAIYNNGRYIYSKSIDFSLGEIYGRFCEIVGEKVDEKEFYDVLVTEGLKSAKEQYHQTLMKIFGEIYIAISDIIIYTKRAYQLETIDQLYIGSSYGPIMGLEEYSQNYLGLKSYELNFDYGIKSDEWYTDQLHYLMLLNAQDYMKDSSSIINLTAFPRPPSFIYRPSGQFIISVLLATALGVVFPVAYLIGYYANSAKVSILKTKKNELTIEANRYKSVLKRKREDIRKLNKQIDTLASKYDSKVKTLSVVYDKKVHYRLKSDTFYMIARDLEKFGVRVDTIETKENTLWLSLVSKDDRKLTELIKYIANTHHNEIEEIDIEMIEEDPKSKYFKGVLKVVLR